MAIKTSRHYTSKKNSPVFCRNWKNVLWVLVAMEVLLVFNVLILHGHLHDLDPMTAHHQKMMMWQSTTSMNNITMPREKEDPNPIEHHEIAGLHCAKYGGPSDEIAAEMVYWSDIPEDATFVSPYKDATKKKYLTFHPEVGGWNNQRMSLETVIVLALAMGRILVLPPARPITHMYLDNNKTNNKFKFENDFFHFDSLQREHGDALQMISVEDFIAQEAVPGHLRNRQTNEVQYPPKSITKPLVYEGGSKEDEEDQDSYLEKEHRFWKYMRQVAAVPEWSYDTCIAIIPKTPGAQGAAHAAQYQDTLFLDNKYSFHRETFRGKPTNVDAPPLDRIKEILAHRKKLCIYDETLQQEPLIHVGDPSLARRLLTHFYSFVFFEDWKQDLWTKRFVRDHLRYVDELQCAAARVVHALRVKAKQEHNNEDFYSLHIRRGDFESHYEDTFLEASEIYENIREEFPDGSMVFVATDEKDKSFFDPLRKHYKLFFLDDFLHLIVGLNKNYYVMLDQLVASRGKVFAGAYLSTFTGYIARLRGYHSQKQKLPGFEKGEVPSYFYAPTKHKNDLHVYEAVYGPTWAREFPVSWRDIDHDIHPEN